MHENSPFIFVGNDARSKNICLLFAVNPSGESEDGLESHEKDHWNCLFELVIYLTKREKNVPIIIKPLRNNAHSRHIYSA